MGSRNLDELVERFGETMVTDNGNRLINASSTI